MSSFDDLSSGTDETDLSENPMQARLSENMQSPTSLIQQGINHLNNPNNGLSYDQKMAAIVPLLQAKHFGGNPPSGMGSGEVAAPQTGSQGIGGVQGATGLMSKMGILNGSVSSDGGKNSKGLLGGLLAAL